MKCYLCNEEIEVYYPELLAFENDFGNITEVYSKTRGHKIINNVCPKCGALQDSNFIEKWFMKHIYDEDFNDRLIWVDKNTYCSICGELIENNQIPIGWELHQRIMGVFQCKNCKSYPKKLEKFC